MSFEAIMLIVAAIIGVGAVVARLRRRPVAVEPTFCPGEPGPVGTVYTSARTEPEPTSEPPAVATTHPGPVASPFAAGPELAPMTARPYAAGMLTPHSDPPPVRYPEDAREIDPLALPADPNQTTPLAYGEPSAERWDRERLLADLAASGWDRHVLRVEGEVQCAP